MFSANLQIRSLLVAVACLFAAACGQTETTVVLTESGDNHRTTPPEPVEVAPVAPPQHGVTIETDAEKIELDDAVVTQGDQGQAIVDDKTGQLVWPALTCTDAECPSREAEHQPFVFVFPLRGARLDTEGYVVVPGDVSPNEQIPECPVCGKRGRVERYVLPEALRRQGELDRELKASRTALRAGGVVPPGVRPPMEIMRERTQLPQLYLPAKYSSPER